jgi:hypothetical protein
MVSLGSATTTTTIERNATLEIDTDAFTATGPVNLLPGSIERWNRETARPGVSYNLPAGVNLQLNTNLIGVRTIGLNGGTIEGFQWIDHPAAVVQRTISSAVYDQLAGQFVRWSKHPARSGLRRRTPATVNSPFGDNVTGAYLQIDGNITGNFDLTKTGLDTVTLAGANNTYRNTVVDLGVLRNGGAKHTSQRGSPYDAPERNARSLRL